MNIKDYIRRIRDFANSPIMIAQKRHFEAIMLLLSKSMVQQIKSHGVYENIHDAEFKVFSQFGDDGIIQYLINNVDISQKIFIEFGVENYIESNTRFLLVNDNWTGLVMDSSADNIKFIKKDPIYWKYDFNAVCAFVNRDNVNRLFQDNNIVGEIGILSIDIDGNDYWIWNAIEVIVPTIIVIEYNSLFGCRHAITVPYDPEFDRSQAHFSYLYWGASLRALDSLARRKGYQFVGCCSGGNNAYFVKKDRLGAVKPLTVEAGYVESKYRESRDQKGKLSFLKGKERSKVIEEMPVYDIESDKIVQIRELNKSEFK